MPSPTLPRPPAAPISLGALRLMLPYLRPYAGRATAAACALLLAAGLVLTLGQGVRRLIDVGFASPRRLDQAALAMFAVVAALALATAGRFYLVSWLGERVAADLRRDTFARVIGLSAEFFETARTGDILSRMTADVAVLQALIGSSLSLWLRNLLLLLGALVMLVLTSPKLAGIVLLVVPVVMLPLILFGRRERGLSRLAQDRIADLGAYAEETINAMRTVQAYTHEAHDRAHFAGRVEVSVDTALRRVATRSTLILIVILLGFGAITFSLWVGGRDVIAGRLSPGALSSFVFYAVLVATSVASISEVWGEVQRAAGASERLAELLAQTPTITVPAAPLVFPLPALGRVEFERVSFRYPTRPTHAAVEDISFTAEPGETVALVGPSGAGKTTLFQLLLRFYDPRSGVVRLDGVDIAAVDPDALRRRIGVVAQDPVIFGTSAYENIRYGRPDASEAEVYEAAEAAAAGAFLRELPEGLKTHLGERGVRLSGGQRQRIAIARAILRDPSILLLDEATSALDAESERAVQGALVRLAAGRTTLVVAHRLATVRRADRILVIDRGRIVSTGTHEALVREDGLYRRLAALQFSEA